MLPKDQGVGHPTLPFSALPVRCLLVSADAGPAAGLWKRRAVAEETRWGMAAMQQGLLTQAQDIWLEALSKAASGSFSTAGAGLPRCQAHTAVSTY